MASEETPALWVEFVATLGVRRSGDDEDIVDADDSIWKQEKKMPLWRSMRQRVRNHVLMTLEYWGVTTDVTLSKYGRMSRSA